MTTYSECDGSYVPEWLAEYHDYMAWASRCNPWPLQARRPSPPQRALEAEEPLSGATAQAAIRKRALPPTTTGKATQWNSLKTRCA